MSEYLYERVRKRAEKKARGECYDCTSPATSRRVHCAFHGAAYRLRTNRRREARPEVAANDNAKFNAKYQQNKRDWQRKHPATTWCQTNNCYEPACSESTVEVGHPRCSKHLEQMMEQNLSGGYPTFAHGEDALGIRHVSAVLPIPSWTKHTRVSINPKGGGRFLSRAAKEYRDFLAQAVLVNNLYPGPYLRGEYFLEFTVYHMRSDHDQWAGGVTDDLVASGLLGDDKNCEGALLRRVRCATKEEQRIEFRGIEV